MTTFVKSSHGRTTLGKPRVRHTEDQPCPTRGEGATHLLINRGETVVCCGCGLTWAELDAELNERGES